MILVGDVLLGVYTLATAGALFVVVRGIVRPESAEREDSRMGIGDED